MAWLTLNWQTTTTLVLQLWCKEGQLIRLGLNVILLSVLSPQLLEISIIVEA